MTPKILLAVFVGGALGSVARFFVLIGFDSAQVFYLTLELASTTIVNLLGAWFLGVVNSSGFFANKTVRAFWGAGFAGGFTTMSGLALITAGAGFALSEMGYLFWLGVLVQLGLGIAAYWFGVSWPGIKRFSTRGRGA